MKRSNPGLCLIALILAGCSNHKRALPEMPLAEPVMASFKGLSPKVVVLESLNLDIPVGTHIGESRHGWSGSCQNPKPMTYKFGQTKLSKAGYDGMFRDVMQSAGVPVEQPARFAGEEVRKADLNFAATIRQMVVNICFPDTANDVNYAVGESYVSVEWGVFSPVERRVVYSGVTEGRTPPKFATRMGDDGLIAEALRQSLQRLLGLPELASVLVSKPGDTATVAPARPGFTNARRLSGGLSRNMNHVRGAVVTVFANAGQGSGFAVGAGNHVLTAAHVVSGSKFIKVATADGQQHYGEVVSSDAIRDLALIKLDRGQLRPLAMVGAVPPDGAEVYAVGSPLGEKFSMSVTKGVVSGLRKEGKASYLQSDVSVLPGSSGGPLLDGDANVVGVAVSGVALAGAPAGMNFFAPAAEVLKFLEGRP